MTVGNGGEVEVRPAASVLLVRDRSDGVEVFMEKRHLQSGFVAGAYVFPGGRVDPADAIDPARCIGIDDATANRELGLTAGGLAHYVAAVRECFEEAGVLLAYDRSGGLLDFGDPAVEAHFRELRDQLNAGTTSIATIVEREDLRLATDRIGYWSHWITPLGEPRRYDTHFFITEAPERQAAGHDDWELTSSAWVSPREAIARASRKEWLIIFPTLMNLRALADHPSAAAAVAWAKAQPVPLAANLPRVLDGRVVLPGDRGYERAETDVSKIDRAAFERLFFP
jgi:8-oxo-dGTP pyrophosphatase MutT (NUDIX family)